MKFPRIALPVLLLLLICPRQAAAQVLDVKSLLDPRLGRHPVVMEYDGTGYTNSKVKHQDTELDLAEHRGSLVIPVWQTPNNEITFFGSGEMQDIKTRAVLPKSGRKLPSELYDVKFGASYRMVTEDQRLWGLRASFGSASDELFNSEDELVLDALGFVRLPSGERNAWLFFLYFSANREFLNYVPLPGFGYWYEPSDRFQALIGAPTLFFSYRPSGDLTFSAFYFPIRNVQSLVQYRIIEGLFAFGEFQWRNERFYRAGRDDRDDRLYYYEKRLGAGVKADLFKSLSFTLSGGYAFDRFYFEGENYGERHDNRIDVKNGGYLRGVVSLNF